MHRTDGERTIGIAANERARSRGIRDVYTCVYDGMYVCICIYTYTCVYIHPCGGYRGGCEMVGELEAAHASFQASTWGSRGWGSTSSRRILRTRCRWARAGFGKERNKPTCSTRCTLSSDSQPTASPVTCQLDRSTQPVEERMLLPMLLTFPTFCYKLYFPVGCTFFFFFFTLEHHERRKKCSKELGIRYSDVDIQIR